MKSATTTRLGVEHLEDRVVLSTVYASGGTLYIFGDAGANEFAVSRKFVAGVNTYEVVENPHASIRVWRIPVSSVSSYWGLYYRGYAGNDGLRNDTSLNTIAYGEEGNDVLIGGSGHDFLVGGLGGDELSGRGGNDTLLLGTDYNGGSDSWSGRQMAYGGDGNDTVYGSNGADLLFGEGGNDLLYGNAGNDGMNGGLGQDTLYGGAGNDVLDGGRYDGVDYLYGQEGKDSFQYDGYRDSSGRDQNYAMDITFGEQRHA